MGSNDIMKDISEHVTIVKLMDYLGNLVCYGIRTPMACPNYEAVRLLTRVPTSERGQTGPSSWVPDAHSLSPTIQSRMKIKRDK